MPITTCEHPLRPAQMGSHRLGEASRPTARGQIAALHAAGHAVDRGADHWGNLRPAQQKYPSQQVLQAEAQCTRSSRYSV